ncbi:MAG: type III pantothenate kinase [Phycisphaerales bacterium]|nr:type III pantothenate kinase [Phycisphaerales bacterium]
MHVVAISVGNTRTAIGRFCSGKLHGSERIDNTHLQAIVARVQQHAHEFGDDSVVAMASVNETVSLKLRTALEKALDAGVVRIGEDIAVPLGTCLDAGTKPGVDRLLNAAAAWSRYQCACVVVDAGTAVTVDFVDGAGVFQGGAIAPGAAMQLRAMHEGAAALPSLVFATPEDEPFGRNTEQAMLQGVHHGIRGMVQRLVERYASSYGAFPRVIGTGGDAELLFAGDDLVELVEPDLTLHGIDSAVRLASGESQTEGDGSCAHTH